LSEDMRWKGSKFIRVCRQQSSPGTTIRGSTNGNRGDAGVTPADAFVRLSQLKKMLDSELITSQEYDGKKAQILDDL
jgi:hypothetical protein